MSGWRLPIVRWFAGSEIGLKLSTHEPEAEADDDGQHADPAHDREADREDHGPDDEPLAPAAERQGLDDVGERRRVHEPRLGALAAAPDGAVEVVHLPGLEVVQRVDRRDPAGEEGDRECHADQAEDERREPPARGVLALAGLAVRGRRHGRAPGRVSDERTSELVTGPSRRQGKAARTLPPVRRGSIPRSGHRGAENTVTRYACRHPIGDARPPDWVTTYIGSEGLRRRRRPAPRFLPRCVINHSETR